MHNRGHGKRGGRYGKKRRNFWRDWQNEWHHSWDAEEVRHRSSDFGPRPPFPPGKKASEWRSFFHDFMGTFPEDHWAIGGRRFSPWRQGRDDFNPFVATLLSKGGGLLPLYVLHLLSQQPRYGNEIMELISERTGGQWTANPGAIYPLMTMLEEQNLVEGEWEDPHKRTIRVYQLTEAGEQEMTRMKAIMRPKLEEAIAVLQELASDLNGQEYGPIGQQAV